MRILLTHHAPLDDSPVGLAVLQLAHALVAAGHDVQGLIVDSARYATDGFRVRRVVCDPQVTEADLNFRLPRFAASATGPHAFEALSDKQLAQYRDVLREALDEVVQEFDPHLVHGQHVWLLGHLALEAGVPYVLRAWGPELTSCRRDPRYHRFSQEAAENAGRILVANDELRQDLLACFDGLDADAITVLGPEPTQAGDLSRTLDVYYEVLAARFGPDFRP